MRKLLRAACTRRDDKVDPKEQSYLRTCNQEQASFFGTEQTLDVLHTKSVPVKLNTEPAVRLGGFVTSDAS